MTRYVVEGEWDGYTSSQRRIVHREVFDERKHGKGLIEKLRALRCIVYTDATYLEINVREAKPREKIKPILGYKELIREAAYKGGSRVLVSDLNN